MESEIRIALGFVISYLFSKLPRRRVNLFAEELDKAIRDKFNGHWYPDMPFKGSAYRCLRLFDPLDTVIHIAARESGLDVQDIVENLPSELCVWIDPGEVSYRIGEKGTVKILYSKQKDGIVSSIEESPSTGEVRDHCFNPDAQCFKPIDSLSSSMKGMGLGSGDSSPGSITPPNSAPSPVQQPPTFMPKSNTPLIFTTAAFAQTKFGSTKLKNSGKRQMSPTEFSNYIRQRSMVQKKQQHPHQAPSAMFGATSPHNPRSLSPNPQTAQHQNFDPFMMMASANQSHRSNHQRLPMFDAAGYEMFSNSIQNGLGLSSVQHPAHPQQPSIARRPNFLDVSSNAPSLHNSNNNSPTTPASGISSTQHLQQQQQQHNIGANIDEKATLLDPLNFGNVYPSHYQHLLVAN